MSTKKQQQRQQIDWRRSQVLELASKGYSQSDIARVLQVDRSVICRDITYLNQQSKINIRKYIDERLPEEYEKCLVGLNAILREAWNTSQQALQEREKIQALSLAKECYSMKLDLLTNATVVDDAIKFVAGYSNSNSNSSSNCNKKNWQHTKSSDDDKKKVVDDEFQTESETEESTPTVNQVF
ncbi:MAG TPA: hypothetical protein VFI70_08520 [Nitrososphaeraceae archaeon]|nr:hypothetical protein [Nitrososphaeraceae archaeon]